MSRPGSGSGTVLGSSGSAHLVEGAVRLDPIDHALPEAVARAEHTRVPFTLVLARPGPAASPGNPAPVARASDVEDLAAALSVSLSPVQHLYDAGRGYLVVLVPGRSGAGQREAMRLTRRAAAEGAPLFTWAAARYPRDATTAAGLMESAMNRLDGRLVSRVDAAARTPERGTGRYGAAIWAGVAAAVVLGAIAFALHGSGISGPQSATGVLSSGPPGTAAGSGRSGTGSGGAPASGSSGVSGSGTSGSPGGTSGSSGTGTGNGGGAGATTTTSSTTTTTSPTTTTTSPTTTTTSPCNGLVNSVTCTASTLLNGLGL